MIEPRTDHEIISAINDQVRDGRIVEGDLRGTCGVIARYCLSNNGITLSASDALLLVKASLLSLREKLKCKGCGSTQTIEEIRASHPEKLACCFERNMIPADSPCPWWTRCGCGTQSGPHACEWRG